MDVQHYRLGPDELSSTSLSSCSRFLNTKIVETLAKRATAGRDEALRAIRSQQRVEELCIHEEIDGLILV